MPFSFQQMLADILAGYISYAFGTLVIKACVALIASMLYRKICTANSASKKLAGMAISAIAAEICMILGYFAYEAVCLGLGLGAVGAIIGNIGQGIVGVLVACVVSPALFRSHEITEMMNRL